MTNARIATHDPSRTDHMNDAALQPASIGGPPAVLSVRSAVYSYGSDLALKGAHLQLNQGEILAVTGPSGSGKSTLMLIAAGVLRPTAGEVTYKGRVISDESEGERSRLRRSEFGILFQFGQLVPELTAAENVALPLLLDGAKRSSALAVASSWLDRFAVGDLGSTRPPDMSGGQGQRVAAARAMVTEPTVLFADEPTGALDTVSGDLVMAEIVRVARESGTSVMLITHDARVAAYGDREVVVRDGATSGNAIDLNNGGLNTSEIDS